MPSNVPTLPAQTAANTADTDSIYVTGTGSTTDNKMVVSEAKTLFNAEAFNVKHYGAVGDGSTDDTTAIQACIDAVATLTHGSPYDSSYVGGGGIVLLPRGQYLVTSTLDFPGFIEFRGEGALVSQILFDPTSADNLFNGDSAKYTRGTGWEHVRFKDLWIHGDGVGGSAVTGNHSNRGLDLSSVLRFNIDNCIISNFNVGLYSDGTVSNYYSVIRDTEFRNNSRDMDIPVGGPINCSNVLFERPDGNWSGVTPKPDEHVLLGDDVDVTFTGGSFEPGTVVNDANFVCVRTSNSGMTFTGTYVESAYPLVNVDLDSLHAGVQINIPHQGGAPLLLIENVPGSVETGGSDQQIPLKTMLGGGVLLPELKDPFFDKGASSWTLQNDAAFQASAPFLGQVGIVNQLYTTTTSLQTGLLQKIPASALTQFRGQTLHFVMVCRETDLTTQRFMVIDLDNATQFKIETNPLIRYDNGYVMKHISFKYAADGGELQVYERTTPANTSTSRLEIAFIGMYVGGIQEIPYNSLATSDTFNVKDYGATGDGSTDDTAAIQACRTAAEAAKPSKIVFPDGVYFTASTNVFELFTGCHIVFESGASISVSASATLTDASGTDGIYDNGFFYLGDTTAADDITIENAVGTMGRDEVQLIQLGITGSTQSHTLLRENVKLINCKQVNGCGWDIQRTQGLIQGCHFRELASNSLYALSNNGLDIFDNLFEYSGVDTGLTTFGNTAHMILNNSTNVKVHNNTGLWSGGSAIIHRISSLDCENISYIGNTFKHCGQGGIGVTIPSFAGSNRVGRNIVVNNNIISGWVSANAASSHAAIVVGTDQGTGNVEDFNISNNVINFLGPNESWDNSTWDVSGETNSNKDHEATAGSCEAIQVLGEDADAIVSNGVVQGNSISYAKRVGILCNFATGVILSDNSFYRCGYERNASNVPTGSAHAIFCSDSADIVIKGNAFKEMYPGVDGDSSTSSFLISITDCHSIKLSGNHGGGYSTDVAQGAVGLAATCYGGILVNGTADGLFTSIGSYYGADLSAWAISTAYSLNDRVINDTGKVYICTTAGTSAGSGGPTGTGTGISDNTAVWDYQGDAVRCSVIASDNSFHSTFLSLTAIGSHYRMIDEVDLTVLSDDYVMSRTGSSTLYPGVTKVVITNGTNTQTLPDPALSPATEVDIINSGSGTTTVATAAGNIRGDVSLAQYERNTYRAEGDSWYGTR